VTDPVTGPGTDRPALDDLTATEVVRAVLDAERRVLPAVTAAAEPLGRAADLLAGRWRDGGRWLFAGAGTSGRLAWAQAAELPGTFGLDRDRVRALVAGGTDSVDDDEDDLTAATHDVRVLAPAPADALVAVAASGGTPYTLAVAEAARSAGAAVVAVTARAGSALAGLADVAVEVEVGEEVLRGSTRLGAGTAQKLALDALTTAAAARLGRVHGDLMVDVVPANAKLRDRAAAIVAAVSGVGEDEAARALADCKGDTRAAVLAVSAGLDPAEAARLAAAHPRLRDALAATTPAD
jgi:N-acetylmuramic acid 6-phosphate etherase